MAFWNLAESDPGHCAVVGPDGVEHSARQLLEAANQTVHGLRALGLRPGDTLAVALGNEVAMLELYLAATQAGWYITPINTHLTAAEIEYIVKDSDAKALVACEKTQEACRAAARALDFPREA